MKRTNSGTLFALALIFVTGALLRIIDLDQASMGSDVMEFYKISQLGVPPVELVRNSQTYVKGLSPFWFAAHNWFLQTFRLDVDFGTMRLLDAITGCLTILAVYGLGKTIGGRVFGLLVAAYLALHPIHVQLSRECYFYVPVVLGCMLMLWSALNLAYCLERKELPKAAFFMLVLSGYLLTTYVTNASWTFAGVAGIVLYSLLLPATFKKTVSWRIVCILTSGLFLLSLPLLFSDWGLKLAYYQFVGDGAAHWGAVFGEKQFGATIINFLAVVKGFLFGSGGLRGTLNCLVLLLAISGALTKWRKDLQTRALWYLFGGTFVLLFLVHAKSVHLVASRHFVPLFPFFVVFICMGFRQLIVFVEKYAGRSRWPARAAWCFSFLVVVLAFAQPALWAMRVEANSPWQAVARWADEKLPPNSVVLCDRWFTPWNELAVNSSTNAHFTFTIPNEPPNVYMENGWRESAMDYLRDNPFAAYLDRKQYWGRIGPWEEPYELFSRKQEFVDEANIKLHRIGLAYRAPSSDMPVEWQTITIFYNTEKDVVERARHEGKTALLAYGKDWDYVKPWRQTPGWPEQMTQILWIQAGMFLENGRTLRDLNELNQMPQGEVMRYLNQGRWADYRVGAPNSDLHIYNLRDHELNIELLVTGIALSGPIRVRMADKLVEFPASLMVERAIRLIIQPGKQPVRFAVQLNQLLLVLRTEIIELE